MKMCRDMNVIVFYTIKETFSFKGLKYEIPGKVHEENRSLRSAVKLVLLKTRQMKKKSLLSTYF